MRLRVTELEATRSRIEAELSSAIDALCTSEEESVLRAVSIAQVEIAYCGLTMLVTVHIIAD